ncbi:MAG: alpha/beta hydrolase [Nanoarchaeota archaeon]
MKKAIIIHRWDGKPDSDWYQSVSESLKEKEFQVEVPEMPNTAEPEIIAWINKLKEIVPKPNIETYFIGHSIGCQTILRYLESLKGAVQVGKIVLVAPFFTLQNIEDRESERIVKPWLETRIDFEKVKIHLSTLTTIFSDNDPFVSLSDKEIFKSLLGAKVIVEHDKGHFTKDDGFTDFPLVVKEITS